MRIVELGSGWYPVLPLLLVREFGAAQVCTFDISHHYSPARIARAAGEMMQAVAELREDTVLSEVAASGRLPDSIRYFPRTRIQDFRELPGGPADVAVSVSVLEYIPPYCIREILRASKQWLTPDALWFHLIGTSDDRARQDKSLHPLEFLKYGEKQWFRISGNRYGYKNRLRQPQYRSLFKEEGWRIEWEAASIPKEAVTTLDRLRIHEDFRNFSTEELAAGSLRFGLAQAARPQSAASREFSG